MRNRLVLFGIVISALIGIVSQPSVSHCQTVTSTAQDAAAMKAAENKKALEKFQGLNFGLGVGVVSTFSNRQARSAQVVNGTVRVDDPARTSASVLLESHYFLNNDAHPLWAQGPFLGIKPGGENNQIIESIGLGWMFGFRHKENSNSSWNIGIAGTVTPNARILGDGVSRNQPLPAGETEVRFKNATLGGIMVLASFSWNSFE